MRKRSLILCLSAALFLSSMYSVWGAAEPLERTVFTGQVEKEGFPYIQEEMKEDGISVRRDARSYYVSVTGIMIRSEIQSSPVIAAVPDGADASSFPANTWGYSTDDQTYSAVPTTASDPALLANVDGETTGTTSGSVISASIPVYYAANVDTSIPAGSYSNRMTYSAVVDGGITAEATLTSIKVDGQDVSELQGGKANAILVTTNLMAQPYGTPRVYYKTTSPAGYAECGNVVVSG